MRYGDAPVAEALLALARHEWSRPVVLPDLDAAARRRLVQEALRHRQAAALHVAARAAGRHDLARCTAAFSRQSLMQQLRLLAALRQVAAALVDLPWLVVKGPALSLHVYPRTDIRSYGDLDVLVPSTLLERATIALEAAGFETMESDWGVVQGLRLGEIHLRSPEGALVDLHYELVHHGARRDRYRFDSLEMLARRRFVPVQGMSMPVLDATDALLHLCLHGAGSGNDKLVWLTDIHLAVLRDPPQWDAVIGRARAGRLAIVVWLMLDQAVRHLKSPVPRRVLDALRPSRTLAVPYELVTRVDKLPQRDGRYSPVTVLGRVAGGTERETWTNLRKHIAARAADRLRALHVLEPTPPRSAFGGSAASRRATERAAFFASLSAPSGPS